jgi:hypothetical protein
MPRLRLLDPDTYSFEIKSATKRQLKSSREICLVLQLSVEDTTVADFITIANWRDLEAQDRAENKLVALVKCVGLEIDHVIGENGEIKTEAFVGRYGEAEISRPTGHNGVRRNRVAWYVVPVQE